MPFFKPKSKWKEYSQDQFIRKLKKLPEYRRLRQAIGEHAEETALAFRLSPMFGDEGTTAFMREDRGRLSDDPAKRRFWESMGKLLTKELQNALAGHYHIGNLRHRARTLSLGRDLEADALPPNSYGALDTDSEVMKAAKWICSSSNTLRDADDDAPVNLAKVHAALKHVVDNMDVLKLPSLEYLHQRVVDQSQLKPSRMISMEVKYCSTGGGAFLLESTYQLLEGTAAPAQGNDMWRHLACYLVGSIIRSHGFTDGNGRAARAAYACALVQGGVDFVPIKADREKLLHGL